MEVQLENFHYEVLGQGTSPRCVFLHGLLGQGKNWRSIARRFSQFFNCLIYDQRGHGRSFRPSTGYQAENLADDLVRLLDLLGWKDPVHIIGHSMGGRVALEFGHRYPERVAKMVVVDIGPTSSWQSMEVIRDKIEGVPVPFATRKEALDFFKGPFLQRFPSSMVADFFFTNITELPNGTWGWLFYKDGVYQALEASRKQSFWPHFKKITFPTLLLRGEKSLDFSQADFEQVLECNSRILGKVIDNAGHWVHAEQPRQTLKVLEEFFADVVEGVQ